MVIGPPSGRPSHRLATAWRVATLRVGPRFARSSRSDPPAVVGGAGAGAEAAQRAFVAHGVGALEDPVLPRGQAGEDLRLHGLRADEAEVGLEAREGVRGEAVALFQHEPDL